VRITEFSVRVACVFPAGGEVCPGNCSALRCLFCALRELGEKRTADMVAYLSFSLRVEEPFSSYSKPAIAQSDAMQVSLGVIPRNECIHLST